MLVRKLKAGEDGAAAEIFERFASQLVVKARQRLNPGLRQKIDAEGILEQVCAVA